MSKTVHAKVEWNEAQALKAAELVYKYDMRHSPKRYVGWLFIALMQFGIVAALKYNTFTLLFVSTFLVLYWYLLRWWIRKRLIQKFYRKKGLTPRTLHLRCEDEGIFVENRLLSWNDILYTISTNTALLIQTKNELLYIPFDAFESLDDVDACHALLKKHTHLK